MHLTCITHLHTCRTRAEGRVLLGVPLCLLLIIIIMVTYVGVCACHRKKQSSGSPEWHNHSEHFRQNQLVFILLFLDFLHWAQLPRFLLAGMESSLTLTGKCRRGRGRMEDDVRPRRRRLQYSPINCDASSSRKSFIVILDPLAVWCFIKMKALVMATSSRK